VRSDVLETGDWKLVTGFQVRLDVWKLETGNWQLISDVRSDVLEKLELVTDFQVRLDVLETGELETGN